MKVTIPRLGGVAQSLSGRDKGRLYIVVKAEGNRLALVDGEYRTLSNPKYKNCRHVRLMPVFFPEIAERAGEGKDENSEIRAALKRLKKGAEINF